VVPHSVVPHPVAEEKKIEEDFFPGLGVNAGEKNMIETLI